MFVVALLVIYWGMNAPALYGATLICFGILFVLLSIIAEIGLKAAERLACTTCLSSRIVPTSSPVGGHISQTVAAAASTQPRAAPSQPPEAAG